MKKTSLVLIFLTLLIFIIPLSTYAVLNLNPVPAPLVECGNGTPKFDNAGNCIENCPCGIRDFFKLLANIYNFIVKWIATPLAVLALVIGAVFIMVSAGNPNLFNKGKDIVRWAIIGLILIFCSWLIIDFILKTIGYAGTWNVL